MDVKNKYTSRINAECGAVVIVRRVVMRNTRVVVMEFGGNTAVLQIDEAAMLAKALFEQAEAVVDEATIIDAKQND